MSRLLCMRLFKPSERLRRKKRLSNICMMWVQSVLADYGIQLSQIMGACTDGGSEVKRWGNVLLKEMVSGLTVHW